MTIDGLQISGAQLLVLLVTISGFWFQNWQSNKRAKGAKDDNQARQLFVETQIKLAAAELALTAAKAHAETTAAIVAVGGDAKAAYNEANTVNQKIAQVGAGTLKIAESLRDETNARKLSDRLQDDKTRTDKANGHDHDDKPT